MHEKHRSKLKHQRAQTHIHKLKTPCAYCIISSPPSLLSPYTRSTKLMGTSATVYPIDLASTLHLKDISLALHPSNSLLQHFLLIQPEASRQIAHARAQHRVGKDIGPLGHQLGLQVPTKTPLSLEYLVPVTKSQSSSLDAHHLGMNLGWWLKSASMMMTKFPITNCRMHVCRSETELACTKLQEDAARVNLLKLLCYVLRAVRAGIVDNDDFPIKVVLGERVVQELDDWWQVLAYIVGRKDNRVLVLEPHCD